MLLNSADDLIAATEMTSQEAAYVHERLILAPMAVPHDSSVGDFADNYRLMPMLVARTLSEIRPNDTSLHGLISTNEFLIKTFGKGRISRNMVEGGFVRTEKFWRNNDPLGVYRPGDMFYVDDNHPLMPYFPILILAPTAFVVFMVFVATALHFVVR